MADNEIAARLSEELTEWTIEGEGNAVARAYNLDPADNPPREDVVSVEIRTDFDAPFSVSSTAWNDARGMGDLHSSGSAETADEAVGLAVKFANELN